MNPLKIIIILIFLIISINVNAQWYAQYSSTNHFVQDIRFINRYTGWACGGNVILKTTNGGENWIQQPNTAQSGILQIHPVNESVVYATGWCTILKTTDGGQNWIAIRNGVIPCQPILQALWFHNENTGWFGGRVQAMRTLDGCNSIIDSVRVDADIEDLHFRNVTTGVAATYGTIFRTTNSGVNWYEILLPVHNFVPNLRRVTFLSDTGWTVGANNVVYKTTNYGESWDSLTKISMGAQQGLRCIEFSSTLIGYAGGDSGKMFKTMDGGLTWWQQQTTQFGPGPFGSLYAYNDSVVWATGGASGRYIIQTTNGGGLLVQTEENISEIPDDFKLFQNFPNPFNPSTNIQYDLPRDNFVSIKVYDLLGKEVFTLVNEAKQAGSYIVSLNGNNLSSGIYYYKIKAGDFEQVRKMILIR